jgi:hypothetical protein
LYNLIAWTLVCILSPFLYGLESCKQGPVKGVCRALRIATDLAKSTNRFIIQLTSAKLKLLVKVYVLDVFHKPDFCKIIC